MDRNNIGGMIRNLRKANGLSVETVCRELKCSGAYLSQVELGRRNFTLENAFRFEKLCGDDGSITSAIILEAWNKAYVPAAKIGGSSPGLSSSSVNTALKAFGSPGAKNLPTSNTEFNKSGTVVEIGEIAGKKIRLKLEIE